MASDGEEAVSAIDATFGVHPGYRALHAKGVFARGSFTATPAAAKLTTAPHLQGTKVPVTVRFSNGLNEPRGADFTREPRGMAVKFSLPAGGISDVVCVTLPCFYVRSPRDFARFLHASKVRMFGQPGPQFLLFMARHPEAWRAVLATIRPFAPVSYGTTRFNSIHSFRWLAPDGSERYVRYSWLPEAGVHELNAADARQTTRDYLSAELRKRLAGGPIRFTLEVQVAGEGDAINDATAIWPAKRERVSVGTLEITTPVDDPEAGGKIVVFDPTNVVAGIELSDDPLLLLRREAYSISAARRMAALKARSAAARAPKKKAASK